MNTANATAIAAEPKTVPCTKCGGSGQYRNLGVCYQCSGKGRETVGVARAVSGDIAKHVAYLREVYAASANPTEENWTRDFNDSADGCSTYAYCTEALIAILTAGDVDTARRVAAAFKALPNGGHLVWCMASLACDLRTWARMPGASQRLALELAEYAAPMTVNRKGDRVPATTFAFND